MSGSLPATRHTSILHILWRKNNEKKNSNTVRTPYLYPHEYFMRQMGVKVKTEQFGM